MYFPVLYSRSLLVIYFIFSSDLATFLKICSLLYWGRDGIGHVPHILEYRVLRRGQECPLPISSHPVLPSFQSSSPSWACGALLGSMCALAGPAPVSVLPLERPHLGSPLQAVQADFGLVTLWSGRGLDPL